MPPPGSWRWCRKRSPLLLIPFFGSIPVDPAGSRISPGHWRSRREFRRVSCSAEPFIEHQRLNVDQRPPFAIFSKVWAISIAAMASSVSARGGQPARSEVIAVKTQFDVIAASRAGNRSTGCSSRTRQDWHRPEIRHFHSASSPSTFSIAGREHWRDLSGSPFHASV